MGTMKTGANFGFVLPAMVPAGKAQVPRSSAGQTGHDAFKAVKAVMIRAAFVPDEGTLGVARRG
jgi:hypothetical protein